MIASGGTISKVAWHLGQILEARASWACFALVMCVQTLVASTGGVEANWEWFKTLGLSRDGFLSGKFWQIFSYAMLHGGWWHVSLNALFVLVIGSRIERMGGWPMMLRACLAGVLGGGVCHLLLGTGLLAGLSGGGVALLLLLTTLSPQSRMFPLPVTGRSLGLGILLGEACFALIDPALGLPWGCGLGLMLVDQGLGAVFQIGHACHLGGGLAGWLFGRWCLRPRVTLDELRRDRARREHD